MQLFNSSIDSLYPGAPSDPKTVELLQGIAQTIYDKKGFNILILDVRGICTMTDYFVIAEGNVDRHVRAMARAIMDWMHDNRLSPFHLEGMTEGDWVVLDFGYIVIHLFSPELRELYQLEQVWEQGKVLTIKIDTTAKI